MRILVRGWSRDCGTKEIVELDLEAVQFRNDDRQTIWRDRPGIFRRPGRIFISWFQKLRHMGDYRMEMELSRDDILRLFKIYFGDELDEWLFDRAGFTVSPELTKRILRTVKLSDVTLGDLAAMNTASGEEPATADKLASAANIAPFKRRS